MDRPEAKRKRDMWKNIPWEVRAEIRDRINKMPECNEKIILSKAFIDNLSTTDVSCFLAENGVLSRNHRPYSRRRILQIIADYIPEYNQYRKKASQSNNRMDHYKLAWKNRDKTKDAECCFCGSKDRLEMHHMIPAFLGGTADDRNIIFACFSCHKSITDYQRELYPERFKNDIDVG